MVLSYLAEYCQIMLMKKFLSGVASLNIVIHLHRLFTGKLRDVVDFLFIPLYLICYPFIALFRVKEQKSYPHKFGVCLIIKNEAPYIKEWLDYYQIIGADVFYIFDNDSNDNVQEVLKPYIESGVVVYQQIHGKGRQLDAYTLCCKKHKKECQYIAFYDIDEFVYIDPSKKLIDVIDESFANHNDMGALGINWIIFGSGHQEKREDGLVIERFKYRSEKDFEKNRHIKSIVNPRKVVVFRNPHFAFMQKGYNTYSLTGEKVAEAFVSEISLDIRVNHYFCKSKEEYANKKIKGFSDQVGERAMSEFDDHDKNDVFDDSMNPYIEMLKGK